jgi:WD40 repeat protein
MHTITLQRGLLAFLITLIGVNAHAQDADEPLPTGAIARLGTTLLVHLGGLTSVAVSPDGKVVASGVHEEKTVNSEKVISGEGTDAPVIERVSSKRGSLRLWETKTGRLIREIETPHAPVSALGFDPAGKLLFAGCGQYLCAFEVATGKKVWQQDTIEAIDRERIAGDIRTTKVQVVNGKLVTVHEGEFYCAVRTEFVTVSFAYPQQIVRMWDIKTGKPLPLPDALDSTTKAEHKIPRVFHDVALSPDGRFAAVLVSHAEPKPAENRERPSDPFPGASSGGTWKYGNCRLEVIDLATGKVKYTIRDEKGAIACVRFANDGATLAFVAEQKIWLMATATGQKKLLGNDSPGWIDGLTFATNTRLAARVDNQHVHVWDTTSGKPIYPHSVGEHRFDGAIGGNVSAAVHGDTLKLVYADSGKPIQAFSGHRLTPLIRYSSNAKETLVSCDCEQAFLWDTRSWTTKRVLAVAGDIHPVRWGRQPRHWEMDREIALERQLSLRDAKMGLELRDAKYGQRIRRLEHTASSQYNRQFCAAGNRLFTWVEEGVLFTDVATGKSISKIVDREILYLEAAISPRGKFFARRISRNDLEIYAVDSGNHLRDLSPAILEKEKENTAIHSFQFSDDERSIVGEIHSDDTSPDSAGTKACVAIWDVGSGKLIRVVTLWRNIPVDERGRSSALNKVQALALSPDARFIAVAPIESPTVEIWEVASGAKRGELVGHAGTVADIAFSPDGKQLASSSEDTTILIWDLHRPLQPAKLKDRLTGDELAAHLKTLFQPDAAKADVAIWSLIHAAKDSVPFLKTQLRPAPRPDGKHVERLLKALESGDFRTRSKAESELENLGELVLSDLESALKQNNTIEKRRRLESLLQKAQQAALPFGTSQRIGQWRILEVLEKISTPGATEMVRDVAGGACGAQLTLAAQATLTRMQAKGKD